MKKTISFIFVLSLALIFPAKGISANDIDSLKAAINAEHEVAKKLDLYLLLSQEYSRINIDTAKAIANQALTLATKIDQNKSIGQLHLQLGDLAFMQDSINIAEQEFILALPYLKEAGINNKLIKAYISLGNIYVERENYPESLEYYSNTLDLANESNDSTLLPRLYNNMGVVYLNLNNPEKALNLYSKALQLFENVKDSSNIAGTTTNIGSIYISLGDYDIARTYYQKGLEIFEQIGNVFGQAHALYKLGLLDEMQGKYNASIDNLNKCLELQQQMQKHPSGAADFFLAEIYIYLGVAHRNAQNTTEAIKYLDNGYEMADKNNQLGMIALAAEQLSLIYKSEGRPDSALKYYEVFKQYSDSSFNEDHIRKLARLEMQQQYEHKVQEAEVSRKLEEQKRKRQNLIYIFVSGGLLLIVIIVLLLLTLEKNKKKKVESERELLLEKLEGANKELTTYVMYLLRKNELILDIIEKLKKARLDAKPENKRVMAELISELQSSTDTVTWEEFEVRFQQVHTDFYTELSKHHPDLSNNEIRLCAFFKLNMTNKEIAAITYQSLNSIKVARYRLRKKLNIEKEENLNTFLSKF